MTLPLVKTLLVSAMSEAPETRSRELSFKVSFHLPRRL